MPKATREPDVSRRQSSTGCTGLTNYGNPVYMQNDEFEWDDAKSASNIEKHGISFEEACRVFRDPFAIELRDDRQDYDEERYIVVGMSDSRVLVVVYTERETRHRIVSARKAEPNERRYYYVENA